MRLAECQRLVIGGGVLAGLHQIFDDQYPQTPIHIRLILDRRVQKTRQLQLPGNIFQVCHPGIQELHLPAGHAVSRKAADIVGHLGAVPEAVVQLQTRPDQRLADIKIAVVLFLDEIERFQNVFRIGIGQGPHLQHDSEVEGVRLVRLRQLLEGRNTPLGQSDRQLGLVTRNFGAEVTRYDLVGRALNVATQLGAGFDRVQ